VTVVRTSSRPRKGRMDLSTLMGVDCVPEAREGNEVDLTNLLSSDTLLGMNKAKIYQHSCLRCGHRWVSRRSRPLRCASCKTPYWNIPKGERAESETCYFCSSEDILLPEIGIAIGMTGSDYSFCKRCLHEMTAEDFWKAFFLGQGMAWPPKLLSGDE
jgi:hypothetical protein